MDSATWGAYNDLLRVIKCVIDTKIFGLKIQPRLYNHFGWDLKVFCDSDWTGDSETRVSVTGFIIYLLSIPICWCSKSQKGVTLSSTEAKYVAISKAVKELKFIYYFLSDIHIKVNLPIVVKTDNFYVRKCFNPAFVLGTWIHVTTLSENSSKIALKIEFVRSVENDSDLFTKNVNQELHEKHTKKFLEDSGLPVNCYRIGRVLEISTL
jgi:hypothetical protein